jgi:hypothetical protein
MNPGTQAAPVNTIARGIALAMPSSGRVFVAATSNTNAHTYAEDLTIPNGVTVQGRWAVIEGIGGNTWTRNAARTRIRATTNTGVKFPMGAGPGTTLDGVIVERAGTGPIGQGRYAAITITQSSPTIRDFDVSAASGVTLGNPAQAVGIDVIGAVNAPAAPTLSGNPAGGNSVVNSGTGQTSSVGLEAQNARVTVNGVDFTGGSAQAVSAGVILANASGSTFNRGSFTGGIAQSCVGFSSTGDASSIRIEGVTAVGCVRAGNVLMAPRFGAGIVFDACPPNSAGPAPVVRDVSASGGVVGGGTGSQAVGGASLDGCGVRFEGSQIAASTFTGGSGVPSFGSGPEATWGLACTFGGLQNRNGFDAPCSINNVTATGGTVTTATSAGLVCDGTCGNQGANCQGSCREITNSSFNAGAGQVMAHVVIRNSSPSLRQNRLGVSSQALTCGPNALAVGLSLEGAGGSYVNNLIVAGRCQRSIGLMHELRVRSGGAVASPNLNSNTIVSYVSTSGGSQPQFSLGVQIGANVIGTTQLTGGTWRNNIIFAGPALPGGGAFAFQERTANADPAELTNNLFSAGPSSPGQGVYQNEGTTSLDTATQINMLGGATGNLVGDPQFQNAGNQNYSLDSTSPAKAAGAPAGAPTVDLVNAARPNPSGSSPDIGCYEVN